MISNMILILLFGYKDYRDIMQNIHDINDVFWITFFPPTLGLEYLVAEPAKLKQSNQQSHLFQSVKHPNVPRVASHQRI